MEVLAERLRYAINHCKSIDMDNYMLNRNDVEDVGGIELEDLFGSDDETAS
jgi:E3 ubiquitin-protein ligase HERC1